MTDPRPLTPDYSLSEVAEALGMSARWVRAKVADGAMHQRYGHKIRFTPEQVEALRAQFVHTTKPGADRVTTGRKRRPA